MYKNININKCQITNWKRGEKRIWWEKSVKETRVRIGCSAILIIIIIIDRLYVKRKVGGRGLVQVEAAYKIEIINIAEYLNTKYKEDQFVNIVKV